MQIDAATAAILAASVSGLCSAITAIGVVAFTKRSDERRHLRELVVRTATENWKVSVESSRTAHLEIMPLDVFILHMLKLSEILLAKKLKPADLKAKLREVNGVVKIAADEAAEFTSRHIVEEQHRTQQAPKGPGLESP